MGTAEDTTTRVRRIIAEKLGLSIEVATLDMGVRDDYDQGRTLGADSMDMMEIGMEVERVFDLGISDEDASRLNTVQDWVSYVEERCQ